MEEKYINEILNNIDKWNKKHQGKSGLKEMVWERLPFLKDEADTMSKELVELYKTYKQYLEYQKSGKSVLMYDLAIKVNIIKQMLDKGYTETRLQLIRAQYNLKINNHIFRMLNYLINSDDQHKREVNEKIYNPLINNEINIFKLNMAFFIINLIFEKIRDKIDFILEANNEEIEELLEKLVEEYNGDAQTIGEVLASRFEEVRRNEEKHNKYRIMREKLIEKGFNGNRWSLFKTIRNSSSHGEFYPIIREKNEIDIKIDNSGKEKRTMSLPILLTFVDSKISCLSSIKDYDLFIDFYKSTDLLATMEKYKKRGKVDEVIKLLAVLSMYNIVQYNYEPLYEKVTLSDTSTIKKIDILDIKKYFTTSYDIEQKDNHKILETIKNAIGHMHIKYENESITFNNTLVGESCTISIFDLFSFTLISGVYDMSIATIQYQHYVEEVKKRLLNINDIYKYKLYDSKEGDNPTIYNNYLYNNSINNIDNKFKK